jgi:hypothetical protein
MAKKKAKKSTGIDAVYLVAVAVGIGIGVSIGTASGHIVGGLIIGTSVGVVGDIVYFFIKRAKRLKSKKNRSKYHM